jgi:hypothetical protein
VPWTGAHRTTPTGNSAADGDQPQHQPVGRVAHEPQGAGEPVGLSLAEIGPRAVTALLRRLLRSRSAPGRVRAAPVRAVIGGTLDREPRADRRVHLFTLWHTVRDPAVAQALDRAYSTLEAVGRRW